MNINLYEDITEEEIEEILEKEYILKTIEETENRYIFESYESDKIEKGYGYF